MSDIPTDNLIDEATKYYKVSGKSMEGAGIRDGDIVMVDFERAPKVGDFVVSLGDPNLIKSYYQMAGESVLYSANGRTLPYKRDPSGVVIGVVRHA